MISLNQDDENKIIELRVEGKITHDDFEACVKPLEEMIERHGKIKLLEEIVSFSGYELRALWDELKFDVSHWKNFSHCGVVTDKKWIRDFTKLAAPITGMEIKVYELEQIEKARRWLQEVK
ncbi:MAG: SpoIIAA family protein [Planctomycetota bacterium]